MSSLTLLFLSNNLRNIFISLSSIDATLKLADDERFIFHWSFVLESNPKDIKESRKLEYF